MSKLHDALLIEVLRAEVDAARAETDVVRASLRYRLGDLLLQALPISWGAWRVFPRVLFLYRTYRRSYVEKKPAGRVKSSATSSTAIDCNCLIVSTAPVGVEHKPGVHCVTDPAAALERLDAAPLSQLVLRKVDESIVRRLWRLKLQGCHIVWWPESLEAHLPIERYVRVLADECRYGDAA